MVETCSGRLEYKEYWLNNNKWGNSGASQCIYENNGILGWRWNNSGGINYPSVVVGTNFCMWNSLWNIFPIKWKDIKSWTVEVSWNYPKKPTGWWNLAFDINSFFNMCNPPNGGSGKNYIVMIWLQGNEKHSGIVTASDGIHTYYVHDETGEPQPRRNFMLKDEPMSGGNIKINVKKLLGTMGSKLNGEWIIDGIHFGNENSSGPNHSLGTSIGQINITKYDMEINGDRISLGVVDQCDIPIVTMTIG